MDNLTLEQKSKGKEIVEAMEKSSAVAPAPTQPMTYAASAAQYTAHQFGGDEERFAAYFNNKLVN